MTVTVIILGAWDMYGAGREVASRCSWLGTCRACLDRGTSTTSRMAEGAGGRLAKFRRGCMGAGGTSPERPFITFGDMGFAAGILSRVSLLWSVVQYNGLWLSGLYVVPYVFLYLHTPARAYVYSEDRGKPEPPPRPRRCAALEAGGRSRVCVCVCVCVWVCVLCVRVACVCACGR